MVVAAASVSTLWISVGLPNRPLTAAHGWFETNEAAFAFEAFEQRRLLAAYIGTSAHPQLDVECVTRTACVQAEHARATRHRQRAHQHVTRTRIFRTQVDVAVLSARRECRDQHALDELERVGFDQQPVGKRSGVAFVGVADDVFDGAGGVENRLPLHRGRKRRTAATAQP